MWVSVRVYVYFCELIYFANILFDACIKLHDVINPFPFYCGLEIKLCNLQLFVFIMHSSNLSIQSIDKQTICTGGNN